MKALVAADQLEFVNGGWCMHDEAATHYVDMVDQTTLGHTFIATEFGEAAAPRIGWQVLSTHWHTCGRPGASKPRLPPLPLPLPLATFRLLEPSSGSTHSSPPVATRSYSADRPVWPLSHPSRPALC